MVYSAAPSVAGKYVIMLNGITKYYDISKSTNIATIELLINCYTKKVKPKIDS